VRRRDAWDRSPTSPAHSGAGHWQSLHRFIAAERRFAAAMARRRSTRFAYEILRFGVKQGWACLFGGIMVALLLGTHFLYPKDAVLPRYDFIFIAALAAQIAMLALRLETVEEAKIIFVYHAIGTLMELFKTGVGSWLYPEPNYLRILGVPLFSGFMYASIGSYIARAWRLFDFRFSAHPTRGALIGLSSAIYVNFFAHHFIIDLRWALFAVAAFLFRRCWIYYRIWRRPRRMPLLLGLFLVALFIWLAENIGTFSAVWLYPEQLQGWRLVRWGKLGSWFLLLLISYSLVALISKPAAPRAVCAAPLPSERRGFAPAPE
jgi:uncharacterized membrane protein YoaT (DUF817 family)